MRRASTRALLVAALVCLAGARAAAEPAPPRFGLGVDFGFGFGRVDATSDTSLLQIYPSLWLELRVAPRVRVALFLPAVNLALGNITATWLWGDAFVHVDLARVGSGPFVEPGFGAMYVAHDVSHGVVYEVPLRVGWAFRPREGHTRFDVALRPYAQAIVPAGQAAVLAWGGFAELAITRLW